MRRTAYGPGQDQVVVGEGLHVDPAHGQRPAGTVRAGVLHADVADRRLVESGLLPVELLRPRPEPAHLLPVSHADTVSAPPDDFGARNASRT